MSIAVLFAIHGQIAQADGRVMAEILVEGAAPIGSSKALAGGPLEAEELTGLGATGDGGELLSHISGISVIRLGGHGFDPVIRGQQENRLNVILDDAYIHAGCPNRMDPPSSYAALETYDTVTVIKGGQTVEFGGGGSGGTVLFERNTQPPDEGEGVQGKSGVTYKDNGDFKSVYADGTFGDKEGYLRLSGTVTDAGNYEDGRGETVKSAFESKNANVVVGLNPDEESNIEMSVEHNLEEDLLYEGLMMDTTETTNDALRMKYSLNQMGAFTDFKASLYRSDVEHDMDNFTFRSPATNMRTITDSETTGMRVSGMVDGNGVSWKVGMDYKQVDRLAKATMGGADGLTTLNTYMWPDAEIDKAGLFVEMDRPLNQQDTLSAGLRYDRVDFSANKADTTAAYNRAADGINTANEAYTYYYGKTAADAETENNIGGFLRWSRDLEQRDNVYVSLSRTVRSADETEKFLSKWHTTDAMRNVGNPDLDPEKQHQLELGGEFNLAGFALSPSIYYANVSDFILTDKAASQTDILQSDSATIYRNVDVTRWGYDLEVSRDLSESIYSVMTLSYVRAENETDHQAVGETPPLNGALTVSYDTGEWDLGGRLRFADNQDRVDLGDDKGVTPGYGVVDLFASKALENGADIRIGVDNLLDKAYAEHLSPDSVFATDTTDRVFEPGRSVWVKANYRF